MVVVTYDTTSLIFLSTLSLRRATTCLPACFVGAPISIHALLAESDFASAGRFQFVYNFYPRSPCGERHRLKPRQTRTDTNFYPRSPCGERRGVPLSCFARIIFLSTLSLRRATAGIFLNLTFHQHFYPRSPCGERPLTDDVSSGGRIFLSTLSLRRATAKVHKTVGHFCAYETNFMEIASSC